MGGARGRWFGGIGEVQDSIQSESIQDHMMVMMMMMIS